MVIETKRLILRKLTPDDFDCLFEILSNPESMAHYPEPFSREKTRQWIEWNQRNYATYGFGLWAVILKESKQFIGDCGITMQNINGAMRPEIGYHINIAYTGQGYATEAAVACRNYAFDVLEFDAVYSYMKYTNLASQRVAEKTGMSLSTEFKDDNSSMTKVYAMTKQEYLSHKS